MRNLFDQFEQPENRLTHALMCSLQEDRRLLHQFIQWITGKRAPTEELYVLEQTLPGEEETADSDEEEQSNSEESDRRGLPDGWIHDGNDWGVLIESKIESALKPDQLRRHRQTAEKRGFTNLYLLALVTEMPNYSVDEVVTIKKWTELYTWLKEPKQDSDWSRRLTAYMEILEAKLIREGYFKVGTLTVFTGIPFGTNYPYSYIEARRLLQLAMDGLQMRSDLSNDLGIDKNAPRRASITGKTSTSVWDFLQFSKIKDAKRFTEFPHLTLGIHREYLHAVVIVPNGIRSDFRRNLLDGGIEKFFELFQSILIAFSKALGDVKGVVPSVEMVQRRYRSQRAEPSIDARLEFDLRTGFENLSNSDSFPKLQQQWLETVYNALSDRNSNLQLAVGSKFFYAQCPDVNKPEILDHVAGAWLVCKPLLQKMNL